MKTETLRPASVKIETLWEEKSERGHYSDLSGCYQSNWTRLKVEIHLDTSYAFQSSAHVYLWDETKWTHVAEILAMNVKTLEQAKQVLVERAALVLDMDFSC